MPNNGHRWTKDEEAAALAYDSYELFAALYPHITRDAYRIRRQNLRRETTPKSACRVCTLLARLGHRHG